MSRTAGIACLVLCCVFALTANAFAQDLPESDRSKPKKSTTGAVFRSMAVPGWGQFYNESYYKAVAFAVIEGFQIDGIIRMNDKMNASKKVDFHPEQYEDETLRLRAQASNDSTGQKIISYRERRNKTIWFFVGAVLLSMGDAYVDAQLFGIDVSPDLTFKHEMTVGVIASINF